MAWTLGIAVMKINSFQNVALITGAAGWAFSTDLYQPGLTIEAFSKGVCRAVEAVAKGSPCVRKVVRLA
jgi:hypothetical protein